MNEEIDVVYPSEDEIYEQISFIVNHSSPKKRNAIDHVQSLYIFRIYLMMRTFCQSANKSFDLRYIFQYYLEVIVFGLLLIFSLLVPSTA